MKAFIYQCYIKEFFRSIKSLFFTGYLIDGHDWVDIEEHENCKVFVSKCEICGKINISWSK